MTARATPQQRHHYADNGFVFYEHLVSMDEASELLDLIRPALEGEMGHVGFGEPGNKEIKAGRQQQIRIGDDGPVPGLGEHPYRARALALSESLTGCKL